MQQCLRVGYHTGKFALPVFLIAAFGSIASDIVAAKETRSQLDKVGNWALIGSAPGFACFMTYFLLEERITDAKLEKMMEKLRPRAEAGELKVEWVTSGDLKRRALKVTFPGNKSFTFASDPATAEVKMKPLTIFQARRRREFLQKELYDLAASVGLKAPVLDGFFNGGHVHIDIASAFENDPTNLKKFLLDFWSHPELADGILSRDFLNASPIRTKAQLKQIQEVADYLDSLAKAKIPLTTEHLKKLAEYNLVFGKFDLFGLQSCALRIHPDKGTLEVRALRSQKDAASLLAILTMLDARIRFTNSQPESAFSVPTEPYRGMPWHQKVARFTDYLNQMKLKPKPYLELIPKRSWVPLCMRRFGDLVLN